MLVCRANVSLVKQFPCSVGFYDLDTFKFDWAYLECHEMWGLFLSRISKGLIKEEGNIALKSFSNGHLLVWITGASTNASKNTTRLILSRVKEGTTNRI